MKPSPTAPSPLRLYGLLALMVLLWSANFIVGKLALREFSPLILGGLRMVLATVFMAPIYAWHRINRREETNIDRGDWPAMAFMGIFGVALNQLFFALGLNATSVAHCAILISMSPILVLLVSAMAGHEKITPGKVAGMAVAVAGVLLLNVFPARSPDRARGPSLMGDMFILIGALMFALFTVVGKKLTRRNKPVTVTAAAYLGAALTLAPLTIWQLSAEGLGRVTWMGWLSLVYMALFPSVICYLIFFYALTHISATRISALSYLQPLLATLMAAPFLGEQITVPLMAGGGVIFAGVYLTERS